jgi:methionyl-tRNA synthetase
MELIKAAQDKGDSIAKAYLELDFAKAMREIMSIADSANEYFNDKAPWALAKEEGKMDEVQQISTTVLNLYRLIALYLKPVTPTLAEKSEAFLNIEPMQWEDADTILLDHEIQKFKPILQRIEADAFENLLG